MTLARIRIEGTGPATAKVQIDGRDVAKYVTGYRIEHCVGELPRVWLTLVGVDDIDLYADVVAVPPRVAAVLVELGWTAPPGRELLGAAKTPAEASAEHAAFMQAEECSPPSV